MTNLGELMKQAKLMQEKMVEIQKSLAGRTVHSSAGGGMVTVTANGAGEIVSIKFEREVVNPDDTEMLGDLILAAVNDALRQAREMGATEMSALSGGLKFPGLFG